MSRLGLNLGCGDRLIVRHEDIEFVNLDLEPSIRKKADEIGARFQTHDLTRNRLPFDDATVAFINVAQCFEHLNLIDGLRLLPECFRVLKPYGVLRISVPDAALLLRSHARGKLDEFASVQPPVYGQVKSQTLKLGLILFGALHGHGETGHKQCYDEEGLREVLEMVWFSDVKRAAFDQVFDAPVAQDHQLAMTAVKPLWSLS